MRIPKRSSVLAGVLVLTGGLWLAVGETQAQIRGTYEDFPYQQGSLGYRPQGNQLSRNAYRRAPAATRRYAPRPAPRTAPPGYYYPQYYYPQGYAQPGMFGR